MTIPPMLSLFLGWFLSSMQSACSGDKSEIGSSLLRRLSSGLLLGVVCTEIVPSMVLELHNDPPIYLLAPLLGILVSTLVVRALDMFSTHPHRKHKLSLHLVEENDQADAEYKSYSILKIPLKAEENGYNKGKAVKGNGAAYHEASGCVNAISPALKLFINCVLDGLVLGTSLVENFDSTGWSLSAAVTLETCVLGMSFTEGASATTNHEKFILNLIIASGFPLGVLMGLLVTKEFQFNTFFFLSVMGFTTGLLVDIVLEDLMREVYTVESRSPPETSKARGMLMGCIKTCAFYLGFMWCVVSETVLP
eukprot:CAMPEP_0167752310 /NCGR_PEP_ID=MMETSP0110_2-20121227/7064_1 /TAXON_ID=629695 /ORGANISM="Gymnochlora sp., Strain CCMP2014" /LENGTH=307 /DNA_ID=CAMNT_0007637905 /DNA_START=179 /DNA_END=1102 /DNA_ORIENTATION=+